MTLALTCKAWEVDCPFEHKLALLWIAEASSSDGVDSWWRYDPQRLEAMTQIPPRMIDSILSMFMRDGVLSYDRKMSVEFEQAYYLVNIDVWLNTPRYEVVEKERAPESSTVYRKKPIKANLRRQVFERDAYRCRHCGGWKDLAADHVVPESQGGLATLENLQTLCRLCNSKKGAKG